MAVTLTALANNILNLIGRPSPNAPTVPLPAAQKLTPGSGELKVAATDGLSIRVHDTVRATESLTIRVASAMETNAQQL